MTIENKREKRREYMRLYNATEKGAAYNRLHVKNWRKQNPEKRKIQLQKESKKDYNHNKHLKATYGITRVEYLKLFNDQDGKCQICGKHQLEFVKRLAVDHCHQTGKIRGLLCNNCNNILGYAKDNIDNLKNAIIYLEKISAA